MSSERSEFITLDTSKLSAEQRAQLSDAVRKVRKQGVSDVISIDASKLTAAQRTKLTTRLQDVARGIVGADLGLVGAEDAHSSHVDTDGWI
jgi:hypothetical protein